MLMEEACNNVSRVTTLYPGRPYDFFAAFRRFDESELLFNGTGRRRRGGERGEGKKGGNRKTPLANSNGKRLQVANTVYVPHRFTFNSTFKLFQPPRRSQINGIRPPICFSARHDIRAARFNAVRRYSQTRMPPTSLFGTAVYDVTSRELTARYL